MAGAARINFGSFGTSGDGQLLLVRRRSHQVSVLIHNHSNLKSYKSLHSRNFLSKSPDIFSRKIGTDHHTKNHTKIRDTRIQSQDSHHQQTPSGGKRKSWILEILFQMLRFLWKCTWGPIIYIKNEVNIVVLTTDFVVELIKKVAEGVEMIADKFAQSSPEGSQLKKVACMVRDAAGRIAKKAGKIDEDIHIIIDFEEELKKRAETSFPGDGGHVKAMEVKPNEPIMDDQETVDAIEIKVIEPILVDQENVETKELKAMDPVNVEGIEIQAMEQVIHEVVIHQEDMETKQVIDEK